VDTSIAISVRRARPSDAPALAALVNRAYAIEGFFVDGERTTTDEIARVIGDAEGGTFLVIEYAGGIGAAVLFQGPGARRGAAEREAYFGMLSVLPELQGMGLGTRLVRIAEALAEASGASSMTLKIVNLREELARWYKSLGYREVGTAPYSHRPVKRPCHFVEMAKALAPVASSSTSLNRDRHDASAP
jgi:ribosomal protein S18 acetylase RimI-like enzyme